MISLKVQPFGLLDPTKPGVRKILVFFLVDPTQRIPSATEVPPQQRAVMEFYLHNQDRRSRISHLFPEIISEIISQSQSLDRKEAFEIREELMKERSIFINTVAGEFFGRVSNQFIHW